MERPVNPDPEEYQKIRGAFRAARWSGGWCGWFLARAVLGAAVIVGVASRWYFGVALFVVLYGALLVVRRFSQCPRCGLAWGSHELESFVCSGCRLNIGAGLRDK
jgi:hypothetical protein